MSPLWPSTDVPIALAKVCLEEKSGGGINFAAMLHFDPGVQTKRDIAERASQNASLAVTSTRHEKGAMAQL